MAEHASLVRLVAEFDVALDWRGFELHPETPPGGVTLAQLFGAGRVAGMKEYMKRFAAQFGVTDMGHPDRLPNTRRAIAVAEYARDEGRLTPFRLAAMDAHWRRGQDLESDVDLAAIASGVGLDGEAAVAASRDPRLLARVDAAREEASDRGVTGIPTFFFGDFPVVGCQPYETLARVAARAGYRRR